MPSQERPSRRKSGAKVAAPKETKRKKKSRSTKEDGDGAKGVAEKATREKPDSGKKKRKTKEDGVASKESTEKPESKPESKEKKKCRTKSSAEEGDGAKVVPENRSREKPDSGKKKRKTKEDGEGSKESTEKPESKPEPKPESKEKKKKCRTKSSAEEGDRAKVVPEKPSREKTESTKKKAKSRTRSTTDEAEPPKGSAEKLESKPDSKKKRKNKEEGEGSKGSAEKPESKKKPKNKDEGDAAKGSAEKMESKPESKKKKKSRMEEGEVAKGEAKKTAKSSQKSRRKNKADDGNFTPEEQTAAVYSAEHAGTHTSESEGRVVVKQDSDWDDVNMHRQRIRAEGVRDFSDHVVDYSTAKLAEVIELCRQRRALQSGDVISGKNFSYRVGRVLGEGRFSTVHIAAISGDKEHSFAALKTERVHWRSEERFANEARVLRHLLAESKAAGLSKDSVHFPVIYDMDSHSRGKFLALSLLGPSLSDLRALLLPSAGVQLHPKTATHVAAESFAALAELHKLGVLHRHVKPANFCIGSGTADIRRIYAVDFASVALPRAGGGHSASASAVTAPLSAGQRIFCPPEWHKRELHTWRSDMASWLLLAADAFDSTLLPWKTARTASEAALYQAKVAFFKERTRTMRTLPKEMRKITELISLSTGAVDYAGIQKQLIRLREAMDEKYPDVPLKWPTPTNPAQLME